jgi:hypothetical protein
MFKYDLLHLLLDVSSMLEENEEYEDYVRGFIEAAIDFEGSLTLEKFERPNGTTEWLPLLQVGNTNLEILETLQEMTGGLGHISEEKYLTRKNKKWRRFWRWRVRGKELRVILPKIGLIIKEKQRKLLLEVLSILPGSGYNLSDDEKRCLDEIYEEMKELNRKGRNTLEQELNL